MRMLRLLLSLALVLGALFLSCTKHKRAALPDLTNFSVVGPKTYFPGARATVTVNSTSLANGTYTVYYYMFPSGAGVFYPTPKPATLVMSNHSGTFQTPLTDTSAYVDLTFDSIVNADGGWNPVNYHVNQVRLTDSMGLMTVQQGGGDTFRYAIVAAVHNGAYIELSAYSPGPGTLGGVFTGVYNSLGLFIDPAVGTHSFSDLLPGGFGGYTYGFFNDSVNQRLFKQGSVTVATLAPLFTGSFTATCYDSTQLSGTFSCPAP